MRFLGCATTGSAQQRRRSYNSKRLPANTPIRQKPSGGYRFYVQDGKLILESLATVPTELRPVSATVFSVPGFDTTAMFTLDSSGQAHELHLLRQAAMSSTIARASRCITSFTITCAPKR